VNPPREGLAPAVLHALKENPPDTLLYISCMPATLARDLKELCQELPHYEVIRVEGFDMFPQTTHVETLVELQKGKNHV